MSFNEAFEGPQVAVRLLAALEISIAALLLGGCDVDKKYEAQLSNLNRRVTKLEGALSAPLGTDSKSVGGSFNACVLEHIGGVTADLAVSAVKESCMRYVEAPVTSEVLVALQASLAKYVPAQRRYDRTAGALNIELNNGTTITITELTVTVQNKETKQANTYRVRNFLPVGVTTTIGLPQDTTLLMVLPPGRHYFYFPVKELAESQEAFFTTFNWGITSAKGFRD